MATMNSILRIRRAVRSVGFDEDQSDECGTTLESRYPNRRRSEERIARMFAEHRRQLLIEITVVVSIATGIILAVAA
jgi:hypothetical protein